MKNLISMTDFVLQEHNKMMNWQPPYDRNNCSVGSVVVNYAKFLSQKLELWMFVPCKLVDGVWVVLEEPKKYEYVCSNPSNELVEDVELNYNIAVQEYQEAKERVLFEGFEIINKGKWSKTNPLCGLWLSNKNNDCKPFSYCSKGYPKEYYWANINSEKIEDLVKYNLELTPTAKKQIGI